MSHMRPEAREESTGVHNLPKLRRERERQADSALPSKEGTAVSSSVDRRGKQTRPAWNHQVISGTAAYDQMQLEMLESLRNAVEDVRNELAELNRLLHCPNFLSIPHRLKRISANTYEGKYGKKAREEQL